MRLKKILSAVLAAALVATCVAVPGTKAMAADTKIMYADTPEGEGYTVRTIGHWIDPSIGSAKVIDNRAYMGGTTDSLEAYKAGHKGVGNSGDYNKETMPAMTKAQAQIIFEFNVETAGTYTVNFYYASQFKNASTPRTFAYMVNAGDDDAWAADLQYHEYLIYDSISKDDAKPIVDDLKAKGIVGEGGVCSESSAYDNAGWFKIVKETATITLKAGQNKIAICNVDGYDDNELKGINFYAVEYTLKQAAAQSSDQGGQTPQNPQNPQTGVATVVIPVAAVMVASGVVAVKSSKKKDEE